MEAGDNRPPLTIMEDSVDYRNTAHQARPVQPLNDPDFIGAESAFQRAAAKAIQRARAAQLEPVIAATEEPAPKP